MVYPSLPVSLLLLTAVVGSGGAGEQVAVAVDVPSRASGTVGSSAVLPCTFKSSYAEYTTVEIVVIWKVKVFYRGPVLFNVTNRSKGGKEFENTVYTNINGRYRLAGDPRQGDASLELENATLNDNDQYFCRVEIKRQGLSTFMAETNPGITLEVLGVPVILRVSVNVINATHSTVECLAEGQPSPDIIWIDPHNKRLPVNSSDTPVTLGPGEYQTLGELHHPKLGGNYTCLVVNDQGNATQSVHLPKTGQSRHQLIYIIGILVGSFVLVMLIAIILLIRRRKSGKVEFNSASKRAQRNSVQYLKVNGQEQQTSAAEPLTQVNAHGVDAPEVNASFTTVPLTPEVNAHEVDAPKVNGSLTTELLMPEVDAHGVDAPEVKGSLTVEPLTPEVDAPEVNGSLTAEPLTPEVNTHEVDAHGVNAPEVNSSLTVEPLTHEVNAHGVDAHRVDAHGVNAPEANGSLTVETLMPEVDAHGVDVPEANGSLTVETLTPEVNTHEVNAHGVDAHGVDAPEANGSLTAELRTPEQDTEGSDK
ncbi:uncharacterized protein LOC127572887 [Pristis pectinata]|uniref:uncharacterized protein LOC127572887 n=1 Tax=Pristis pectinata TaxID=685728 RepID=UPI00223D6E37|nr:uncharacterized protein LOC127572887 [Pristis pectinata]